MDDSAAAEELSQFDLDGSIRVFEMVISSNVLREQRLQHGLGARIFSSVELQQDNKKLFDDLKNYCKQAIIWLGDSFRVEVRTKVDSLDYYVEMIVPFERSVFEKYSRDIVSEDSLRYGENVGSIFGSSGNSIYLIDNDGQVLPPKAKYLEGDIAQVKLRTNLFYLMENYGKNLVMLDRMVAALTGESGEKIYRVGI